MEGSESEAVFDSLKLNPQLFINEVLNAVDDLVDGAFNFYHQQASTVLQTDATDRAEDLRKGIAQVRGMVQSALDTGLYTWEKFCLRHCFVVPEGFHLPNANESLDKSSISVGALCDPDLDVQLNLLRTKIAEVGKESAELKQELQEVEKQSVLRNNYSVSIKEILQSHEQQSLHDMFQELVETAAQLRKKIEQQKSRIEEDEVTKLERICSDGDFSLSSCSKGFSNARLKDLQEFLASIRNV